MSTSETIVEGVSQGAVEPAPARLPVAGGPSLPLPGRFEPRGLLGASGLSLVLRAWDRLHGRLVAVKVPRDRRLLDVWLLSANNELEASARVRHPHVRRVRELILGAGTALLVCDLARGPLEDAHGSRPRSPPARASARRSILRDLLDVTAGVAALHAHGIVHGDLKASNVLRMADGRLVVADLGLAVIAGLPAPPRGYTPGCEPPGWADDPRPSRHSDVWQLGRLLATMHSQVASEAHLGTRSPVDTRLLALVQRCTVSEPGARPADAQVVWSNLRRLARSPWERGRA
jgi:serine/threonine protein kinase